MKLVELLADKRAVLFDFDGPVCDVFAGLRASDIAADLVALLRRLDVEMTPVLAAERDPMAVLRFAATAEPAVTRAVEDALCAAELAAVDMARPTRGGVETVLACLAAGKVAAVVSNNSAAAVHRYLDSHDLTGTVWPVVGRPYAEPDRMKPSPEPLERTLAQLPVAAGEAVLIGVCRSRWKTASGGLNWVPVPRTRRHIGQS
ncbi:Phosphoglycolate phosphatase, HAD superfamily [Goodfellowiella coeruleoviolacea]|uniref:Phosphoglycolate phosphatase, HAD superfamily n=2 Tax=Goodfellowiella coeruleoviolacea TaxID=334858 RepID=A0AAE3GE34_9PSEU|nr:Phosphoglycolate phosphatase, HAD superfamily [Goodfellowiella coeruleoviolacea]